VAALITADEILACSPCRAWPAERVRALVGDGITPEALARRADVSLADRRWALTQVLARRDRHALVRWACDCAVSVRHLLAGDALDAADLAVQTALAWCEGDAPEEDCRAAYAAANADYAAAWAAYAATYAAAYAAWAAYAAAYAAAADTAAYAADTAAYAAKQDMLDALAAYYTKGAP
jgi:hypothetical protein